MIATENPKPGSTPEDVANAYWIILGRQPEDEAVAAARPETSVAELLIDFMASPEFQFNIVNPALAGEPVDDPDLADEMAEWVAELLGVVPTGRHRRLMALADIVECFATQLQPQTEWSPESLVQALRAISCRAILHAPVIIEDVGHAFSLFLGRVPHSAEEAAAKLGRSSMALALELVASTEFAFGVARPLLTSVSDDERFLARPSSHTTQWASSRLDLTDETRTQILGSQDWRQLLFFLFHDQTFRRHIDTLDLEFNIDLFCNAIVIWPLIFSLSDCDAGEFLEAAASPAEVPHFVFRPDQGSELDSGDSVFTRESIVDLARASGFCDEEYYRSAYPDVAAAQMDPVRHYIDHGWKENRNPSNDFDTAFYLRSRPESVEVPGGPLIHYLRKGQRSGQACLPPNTVFLGADDKDILEVGQRLSGQRLAIHLHLFYPELVEEFAAYLASIPYQFDLFVSTCTSKNVDFLRKVLFRLLPGITTTIVAVENRGRDLAPLFVEFADLWVRYDFICHVHGKRSPHTAFGDRWRSWILDNMFGRSTIVAACLDHFLAAPRCGMLFPDNYFEIKKFAVWGVHQADIRAALSRLGCMQPYFPRFASFAAGSMAWFRCSAFKKVHEAKLKIEEFSPELGQEDGTLAHALERALPLIAADAGYHASSYVLPRRSSIGEIHRSYGSADNAEAAGKSWMRETPAISVHQPKPVAPLFKLFGPKRMTINWIIPDFGLGAGGHMTIFRMVELLASFGHHQTIWIQNAQNHRSPLEAKQKIQRHYRPIPDSVGVRFLPDDVRQISGDVVIATDCWTVFPATNVTNVKSRFYFIQDYEPLFHPMGENNLIAASTYEMGLNALCAGAWLEGKAKAHGMWTRTWSLASDPEFYFPGNRIFEAKRRPRIAFYCRSYTPRRATNLGLAAFEELHRRGVEFDLVLFGEEARPRGVSFAYEEYGIAPPAQLADLYRDCDIGVVFSTTNYSLVPLEMMACNLPVVEIDTESTRAAFPDGTCELAVGNPHAVADALEKLIADPVLQRANAKRGRQFVDGLSWSDSARVIEAALRERLLLDGARPIDAIAVCSPSLASQRRASVIIPTFNGGEAFKTVLERVANQAADFDYDVLVVDSSSNDGTAEFTRKAGGRVRMIGIKQSDFQHGRTRNFAISQTDGDFVAVLTQDALPADDRWLQNLIGGFGQSDRVAGVIGRHLAYPEHGPFVARDLQNMFQRINELGPTFGLDTPLPSFVYPQGLDWRMTMHFYSDNNSAMARRVWNELPYPEIDWGEDQVWCWEALKLGFHKAYVHDAVVFHSHRLPPAKQYDVALNEGRLFAKYFGYKLYDSPAAAAHQIAHTAESERAYAMARGIATAQLQYYIQMSRITVEGRIRGRALVTKE